MGKNENVNYVDGSAFKADIIKEMRDYFGPQIQELKRVNAENMAKLTTTASSSGSSQNLDAGTQNVQDISPALEALEKKFSDFETKIERRLVSLTRLCEDNATKLDEMDQNNRYTTLLVHGVPEKAKEIAAEVFAEVAVKHLQLDLQPAGSLCRVIDSCYRLGKPRSAAEAAKAKGPRPLLVRFTTTSWRDLTWLNKKNLKGTKIFMSESLTKFRQDLLLRAKEKFGPKNAWSMGGNIFATVNNKKVAIRNLKDLQ